MKNTFGKSIVPANDKERLACLKSYHILDSPPEKHFNDIAMIMAKVFNVPIALIAFVDEEEVFFKANVGMKGTSRVDRGVSLCSLAILEPEPTIFENAINEPCLLANPLVQGEFGLRFYGGAPLISKDGFNIGTVCIVDKKKRFFNSEQVSLLKHFSALTMNILELHYRN